MTWRSGRVRSRGAGRYVVGVYDLDLLAPLSREQLTAQYHARWLLYQHLRSIWETAKADPLARTTSRAGR